MPETIPKHLLIVDDDPIYAGFVQSTIADAGLGLTSHCVSTLDSALAYIRAEPPFGNRVAHPMPAIVLLDINLSLQRGFPVLNLLREDGHLENGKTCVIMLSASNRPEDFHEALRLGAVSYLVKSPIASTITNLLSKFVRS